VGGKAAPGRRERHGRRLVVGKGRSVSVAETAARGAVQKGVLAGEASALGARQGRADRLTNNIHIPLEVLALAPPLHRLEPPALGDGEPLDRKKHLQRKAGWGFGNARRAREQQHL
jgi:hypothetical protein